MCTRPIAMYKRGNVYRRTLPPFALSDCPDLFVPCGKCEECRERKRQDWTRRIVVENFLHDASSFITLTYDDKHLPNPPKCSKFHVQKFLKRFRNVFRDYGILVKDFKYFIVSEYGEKFGRPHYHGVLFGVDFHRPCWRSRLASIKDKHPIYTSEVLEEIWSQGFVSFDIVTPSSVAYVTKYVTKNTADNFKLFSRGLGKGFFFQNEALTPRGLQAYDNGFIVLPVGRSGFIKSPIPKNIDRYCKLYEPMKWAEVSHIRQDFAQRKRIDTRSTAERVAIQKIHDKAEKQKRKLDNEI